MQYGVRDAKEKGETLEKDTHYIAHTSVCFAIVRPAP